MSEAITYDSIMVLGPTASGKTQLAVELASICRGEVLSADSRMVYRKLDIGTGKDLHEYHNNGNHIPYHLIDLVDPEEDYHIYRYQEDFRQAFEKVKAKHKTPVICGGSGLYLEAVLYDYQHTSIPVNEALRLELQDMPLEFLQKKISQTRAAQMPEALSSDTHKRAVRSLEILDYLEKHPEFEFKKAAPIHPFVLGLNPDLNLRRSKIENRLKLRLNQGLIDEVEHLMKEGLSYERLQFFGLEYKFVSDYLIEKIKITELKELLTIAIQQFAKRQMTWFRKMERYGLEIHWVEGFEEASNLIPKYMIQD